MTWQLPRVQTVYECNVIIIVYLIQAMYVILPPSENGPFLLMEAIVAAGSAMEGKQKTNDQELLCRVPTVV